MPVWELNVTGASMVGGSNKSVAVAVLVVAAAAAVVVEVALLLLLTLALALLILLLDAARALVGRVPHASWCTKDRSTTTQSDRAILLAPME